MGHDSDGARGREEALPDASALGGGIGCNLGSVREVEEERVKGITPKGLNVLDEGTLDRSIHSHGEGSDGSPVRHCCRLARKRDTLLDSNGWALFPSRATVRAAIRPTSASAI